MQLTEEQVKILQSTGDIKINAVAGSGKTTTVIEYAKSRSSNARILYLAFNKSVKLEAQKKFTAKGLHNVLVETAHSLAFKHIVPKHNYQIKANGYKTNELVQVLQLSNSGEKLLEFVFANHISKFAAYFCNSDKLKISELNYLDIVSGEKATKLVKVNYKYIEHQTRIFLSKMDKGEIEITHDFYLKKFQLAQPQLNFDYILFDEGQDASAAMLDVFFKQKATKVIVGDTHQQIYGWRFAVNSLEKASYPTYFLSASFRFCENIAKLAIQTLQYKTLINQSIDFKINGLGNESNIKSNAIIARTNLGLLLKAIEYVTETKNDKKIYFEGNINSYTYADDGTSLYDVLNLHLGKKHAIKDSLIKQMTTLSDLEDYIRKTEDIQLGMMAEIVKEYEGEIPAIIQKIKNRHVENDKKELANMVFSTVHRCKGMEYDCVELVNDFVNEEKIENSLLKNGNDDYALAKINEEINLLYVAVTRTKNILKIPETLLPKDFPTSPKIVVIKVAEDTKNETKQTKSTFNPAPKPSSKTPSKSNYMLESKEKYGSAYAPWTFDLDEELLEMYQSGYTMKEMAEHFGRSRGAIISRIEKLELREEEF